MGIFKRIKALTSGFFSKMTGNLEQRNPDLLLENVKNKIEKARKEAEKCIIEIQTNAELERLEIRNHERALSNIKRQIEAAVEQKDKDLLVELLMKEEEESSLIEEKRKVHAEAAQEAVRIQNQYKAFESEMNARLAEIRTLKSKSRLAYIKENISKLDENFMNISVGSSNSEINDTMNKAREIVNYNEARAAAKENLREESIDAKIRNIDISMKRSAAVKRAEELLSESV